MSLEIFQTLGAVVGFVAGAITLYDRLLRYKPFVSIYAEVEGGECMAVPATDERGSL